MQRKVGREVGDFGNSTVQFLIDGQYFEMPMAVTELSEKSAKQMFAEAVDRENLHRELILKCKINEKEKYYAVGEKAQSESLANRHLDRLHDKTESEFVYVVFLATNAFYHGYRYPDAKDEVEKLQIGYFSTMLPVWLLKQADSFKGQLQKMADRFKGDHEVELLTPGFERKIKIEVERTDCRIEGEVARLALKYDLELNERDNASRYQDCYTVVGDIGAQTLDLSRLRPGLSRPTSADDFESFTDRSWLKSLESLRNSKFPHLFRDLRSFERFVMEHVPKKEFVYKDPVTTEEHDLTQQIESTIREFIKVVLNKELTAFQFPAGSKVVFLHIGGIAQLLKDYMQNFISEEYGPEAKQNHIFPDEARKLNLYGLEIIAKNETLGNEQEKEDEQEEEQKETASEESTA